MRNWKTLLFVAAVIFLSACANQSAPNGGPRDESPPGIASSSSENGSTNFNKDEIVLEFDEFVNLQDADNQIIISPTPKEKPKIFLKGKKLIIRFNEELDANTTYHIQFNDAISDITENNKAQNIDFTFSTGNQIDSLEFEGQVFDAELGNPLKDVLVGLYLTDDDSIAYKEKPKYITKSKENGKFKFSFLPDEQFKIYALSDENKNAIYNDINEKIAFSNIPVVPADTTAKMRRLYLFNKSKLKRIKSPVFSDSSKIVLPFEGSESELENIKIEPVNFQIISTEWNYSGDSIYLFVESNNLEDLYFTANYKDDFTDSLKVRQKQIKKYKSFFGIDVCKNPKLRSAPKLNPEKDIIIEAPFPIKSFDDNRLKIKEDSLLFTEYTVAQSPEAERLIQISANWKPNTVYTIETDSAFIVDKLNRWSKKDTILLKTLSEEDYSEINIRLNNTNSSYSYYGIIKDGEEKEVRRSLITADTISFKKLAVGSYFVYILEDENQNGAWDNGNLDLKLQPERVYSSGEKAFKLKSGLIREIIINIFD